MLRIFNLNRYIFTGKRRSIPTNHRSACDQHAFASFRASILAVLLRKNALRLKRLVLRDFTRQTSEIVVRATMSEFNAVKAQNKPLSGMSVGVEYPYISFFYENQLQKSVK